MNRKIEFNRLDRVHADYILEIDDAIKNVIKSGRFILGAQLEAFEHEFALWNKAEYAVGLNSGFDALYIALRAIGIKEGDEVILPANSYIASALAVSQCGATPVFVDVDCYYNMDITKLEVAINNKTKAIIAVHLFGQACDIIEIQRVAKSNGLYLLEDCAQAHGALVNGQCAGTFGDVGCFSFFPTKNLGAMGDGGAIITNDKQIALTIKKIRNYGSDKKYCHDILGMNSRLDEIQSAVLRIKLKHLDEINKERVALSNYYSDGIKTRDIILPKIKGCIESHVFHLYVVRIKGNRELFIEYLENHNIKTQIHYPTPIHLSKCYDYLNHGLGDFPMSEAYASQSLSLPLYNGMYNDEIDYVIDTINRY